jgi:hypothetical protein
MAKRRKSLAACPPGPFLFEGRLGFKTEYGMALGRDMGGGKVEWEITHYPEAFCMDSGEVFWGGAKDHESRARLMVTPVDVAPLA